MYLILSSTSLGLQVVGYSTDDPGVSSYVPVESVPFPSELSGISDSWVDACDRSFSGLFTLDPLTYQPSLVPISSWTKPLSLYGVANRLRWTYGGVENLWVGSPADESFFSSAYPSQESPYAYSWDEAEVLSTLLQNEMTADLNSYLISGTPLDPVFAALNNTLNDLQGTYSTPTEAVEAMQGGLTSLALSLGQSWPPPDPA